MIQGHFRVCPWILGKDIDLNGKKIKISRAVTFLLADLSGHLHEPKKFLTQNLFRWLTNVTTYIYISHDKFQSVSPEKIQEGGQNPPHPPVLIGLTKTRHKLIS